MYRESGFKKDKKKFIVKKVVYPFGSNKKPLEESVTTSQVGILKGNQPMLRPFKSKYSVWFEGKEYNPTYQFTSQLPIVCMSVDATFKKLTTNNSHA